MTNRSCASAGALLRSERTGGRTTPSRQTLPFGSGAHTLSLQPAFPLCHRLLQTTQRISQSVARFGIFAGEDAYDIGPGSDSDAADEDPEPRCRAPALQGTAAAMKQEGAPPRGGAEVFAKGRGAPKGRPEEPRNGLVSSPDAERRSGTAGVCAVDEAGGLQGRALGGECQRKAGKAGERDAAEGGSAT